MTLTFLQYNNYYNRILKRKETINAYLQAATEVATISDTDFNPNDNIITEKVVNLDFGLYPDYMLQLDPNTNAILSRWFVMECKRLRKGQYKITLKRDLVADYYNDILDSPMFIEKGYVNTANNLIYNPENMSFNQIKKRETLLKDNTGIPWIVGYVSLPKKDEHNNDEEDKIIEFRQAQVAPGIIEPTRSGWVDNFYTSPRTYIATESYSIAVEYQSTGNIFAVEFNESGVIDYDTLFNGQQSPKLKIGHRDNMSRLVDRINQGLNLTNTKRALGNIIGGRTEITGYNEAKALDKQVIKFTDENKLYQIKFHEEPVENTQPFTSLGTTVFAESAGLFYELTQVISQINTPSSIITGSPAQYLSGTAVSASSFGYKYTGKKFYIELVEISAQQSESITVKHTRRQLEDAPYCMFCIPYGAIEVKHSGGAYESEPDIGLNIGTAFRATSWCYDVQILPYCPLATIREQGFIDIRNMTADVDYSLPTNLQYSQQVVLWCSYSSGTFDIELVRTVPSDPVEFKVGALTKMQRFCSPNYASIFEFNMHKNNGIQYVNVDFNYKPVNPYIHINPNFNRLYGSDYDDPRGLVCSGDFSISAVSDAWLNYELNNKNYNTIFERQIENMETNRGFQRIEQIVGSVVGTGQGAGTGAMLGGMSPIGGGTGAILGAGLSAIGGVADYFLSEAKFNEQLDYTRDLHGYQLQNIQALPNTLTKVSALNRNNKLFPVFEEYEASLVEENALRDKLKYNGMSVGVISTLRKSLGSVSPWYYKGQLIRNESIGDDFHTVNALAEELNKGVFI